MKLILLTHSREIQKASNTGQLVQKVVANTQTIIWQRTQPDLSLLDLINSEKTALLYPELNESGDEVSVVDAANFENFILIDSTWQESRKIFNRSPYLQQLPRIQLSAELSSSYHLRRNQVEGGLCTAECAVELLRVKGFDLLAEELEGEFFSFIR